MAEWKLSIYSIVFKTIGYRTIKLIFIQKNICLKISRGTQFPSVVPQVKHWLLANTYWKLFTVEMLSFIFTAINVVLLLKCKYNYFQLKIIVLKAKNKNRWLLKWIY